MKKLVLAFALAALSLTGSASADIQAPPGADYTSTRKLGRGISNILYGLVEIPEQIVRRKTAANSRSATFGLVDGTSRAFRRLGYGFYELVTFHCPTYRGTFKPPYERCGQDGRIEMDPTNGLSEFPPQLGAEFYNHVRHNTY